MKYWILCAFMTYQNLFELSPPVATPFFDHLSFQTKKIMDMKNMTKYRMSSCLKNMYMNIHKTKRLK